MLRRVSRPTDVSRVGFVPAVASLLLCGPAKGRNDAARNRRRVSGASAPQAQEGREGHGLQIFSPDYLAAKFCTRQTATSGSCSLPLYQYLPSPRPSGGSLVIIGPGTGYQGQWLLWGPDGAVGPDRGRRWPHTRVTPAGAPCCRHWRDGEVDLTAEPLADDRDRGMNSLLLPEPTHPKRYSKFKTRRSCALRNPNQRKAALSFISAPARRSRRRTTCDMSSKLRGTGRQGTDSLD